MLKEVVEETTFLPPAISPDCDMSPKVVVCDENMIYFAHDQGSQPARGNVSLRLGINAVAISLAPPPCSERVTSLECS